MVVCKTENCAFYMNGFCTSRLISIDDNGMCSQLWYKGQRKFNAFAPVEDQFKKPVHIAEVSLADLKMAGEDNEDK